MDFLQLLLLFHANFIICLDRRRLQSYVQFPFHSVYIIICTANMHEWQRIGGIFALIYKSCCVIKQQIPLSSTYNRVLKFYAVQSNNEKSYCSCVHMFRAKVYIITVHARKNKQLKYSNVTHTTVTVLLRDLQPPKLNS